MKQLFTILFCVLSLCVQAQNLNWTNPEPTGTGNATVLFIASPPAALFNNNVVTTVGSLLGVFYQNNDGDLTCAGYTELGQDYMNGSNIAIAVWGADPGEDNGMATGETMLFYLNLDGIDYQANDITLLQGEDVFVVNL